MFVLCLLCSWNEYNTFLWNALLYYLGFILSHRFTVYTPIVLQILHIIVLLHIIQIYESIFTLNYMHVNKIITCESTIKYYNRHRNTLSRSLSQIFKLRIANKNFKSQEFNVTLINSNLIRIWNVSFVFFLKYV